MSAVSTHITQRSKKVSEATRGDLVSTVCGRHFYVERVRDKEKFLPTTKKFTYEVLGYVNYRTILEKEIRLLRITSEAIPFFPCVASQVEYLMKVFLRII